MGAGLDGWLKSRSCGGVSCVDEMGLLFLSWGSRGREFD